MKWGRAASFLLQKIQISVRIYKSTFASIVRKLWKLWLRKLTFDPELSSRGIQRLIHPKENGETIQKRRSRVLPKGKFRKFLTIFFWMTGKFQIFQKFKKRERVSRASEPQVIIAETIPVPDRYQTGIYNSKRKRFQRVKSVSSPNLLETALCNDERYFSENKKL